MVKMAVTHFVTRFTHVPRHFGVYCRKQIKQMFRENCFEIVVSDKKKWPMCPQCVKKNIKKNNENI